MGNGLELTPMGCWEPASRHWGRSETPLLLCQRSPLEPQALSLERYIHSVILQTDQRATRQGDPVHVTGMGKQGCEVVEVGVVQLS